MNIAPALAVVASLFLALSASADAQQRQRRASSDTPADCTTQQGAMPTAWSGQAYAIDGDTLAGVSLKPHIRLWGIQAPELRDQSKGERISGMRARAVLEDLLSGNGHKITCKVSKFDRYCRLVAQCSLDAGPQSVDLSGALLAGGMAYGFYLDEVLPWEPKASERYATAEAEARKKRAGLWPVWLGEEPEGK